VYESSSPYSTTARGVPDGIESCAGPYGDSALRIRTRLACAAVFTPRLCNPGEVLGPVKRKSLRYPGATICRRTRDRENGRRGAGGVPCISSQISLPFQEEMRRGLDTVVAVSAAVANAKAALGRLIRLSLAG
jgi:hypothetical protein